jgi:hypothetical protein
VLRLVQCFVRRDFAHLDALPTQHVN